MLQKKSVPEFKNSPQFRNPEGILLFYTFKIHVVCEDGKGGLSLICKKHLFIYLFIHYESPKEYVITVCYFYTQAGQTGYVDIDEQVSTIDNQRVVISTIENSGSQGKGCLHLHRCIDHASFCHVMFSIIHFVHVFIVEYIPFIPPYLLSY